MKTGGTVRRAATEIVLGAALVSVLLTGAATAVAAPASSTNSSSAVEIKKSEKKAALADLERMREDLAAQLDKYVSTGRRLLQTEQDIQEVTTEIAEQDASLKAAERALVQRAVQLYRSDRLGMMEILFSADSIPELMDHMSYLVAAGRHDTQLIDRVRMQRQESLWLQQSLNERASLLAELQLSADEQRSRIESDMAAQQAKADTIGEDIARLMRIQSTVQSFGGGSAPETQFTPDTIISQQRFRNVASMDVADIQRFLNQQPGTLKYYRAPDHEGKTKSAAEMIAEAASKWSVNPQVILVTLQKEQSLLSQAQPAQRAYDWAMGCGKMDSRTLTKYQGFGNQIWYGTKSLNNNADRWEDGAELKIDGSVVIPSNAATYGLYKYTPHLHGNLSFWMLHWRYFGDPLSVPPTS
ncbi:MAG TPA: hypothetical protein VLA05_02795 [Coriobacteriia bacterium]|nr:hypothetical protein [Coriobacteriia bacterium]